MKVYFKHLINRDAVLIEIPDNYMIVLEPEMIIHDLKGDDHFLIYDDVRDKKFKTTKEMGFVQNTNGSYKNVYGDRLEVGDVWIVLEKIR